MNKITISQHVFFFFSFFFDRGRDNNNIRSDNENRPKRREERLAGINQRRNNIAKFAEAGLLIARFL